MRYIIVDTGVFIRALGRIDECEDFLNAFCEKYDDKIVFTTKIKREYRNKISLGGFTFDIFNRYVKELKRNGKIKEIEQSKIDRIDLSSCKKPKPGGRDDMKFIEAAMAAKASCIITRDRGHLLVLDPYKCNDHLIRICPPEKYVAESYD